MNIMCRCIVIAFYMGCFCCLIFRHVMANDTRCVNDYGFKQAYQYIIDNQLPMEFEGLSMETWKTEKIGSFEHTKIPEADIKILRARVKNFKEHPRKNFVPIKPDTKVLLELKSFLYDDVFKYIENEKINDIKVIFAMSGGLEDVHQAIILTDTEMHSLQYIRMSILGEKKYTILKRKMANSVQHALVEVKEILKDPKDLVAMNALGISYDAPLCFISYQNSPNYFGKIMDYPRFNKLSEKSTVKNSLALLIDCAITEFGKNTNE